FWISAVLQFVEFHCLSDTVETSLRHLSPQVIVNTTPFYKAEVKEAAIKDDCNSDAERSDQGQFFGTCSFGREPYDDCGDSKRYADQGDERQTSYNEEASS